MAMLLTLLSFIEIRDGIEEDTSFHFSDPQHQNKRYQTPLGKKLHAT